MAYLFSQGAVRGGDVTVDESQHHLRVEREAVAGDRGLPPQSDRAFMQILVERLSVANLRLSGV
jgi:hypothetical protein